MGAWQAYFENRVAFSLGECNGGIMENKIGSQFRVPG